MGQYDLVRQQVDSGGRQSRSAFEQGQGMGLVCQPCSFGAAFTRCRVSDDLFGAAQCERERCKRDLSLAGREKHTDKAVGRRRNDDAIAMLGMADSLARYEVSDVETHEILGWYRPIQCSVLLSSEA